MLDHAYYQQLAIQSLVHFDHSSETPGEIRHRAPTLGEHTDEIMRELGYSDEVIADLHEQRII